MNLDEAQKMKVSEWIAQGMKLSDIQKNLDAELGVTLTYMEVRFLVDDLKLTPKDPEPPKAVGPLEQKPSADSTSPAEGFELDEESSDLRQPAIDGGKVSIAVDRLARPGTIVSGSVTFRDGKAASWHLDQLGRLGLVPKEPGYKPPTADLQSFQIQLQKELAKMGF